MNISNSQVNRLRHFVRAGLRSLFRPEPQTAVEWADANYYLPKESAYQEGRWETLPFQRAIMNAMGSDYVREVNVVKSARVGYSKMLLGVYAYFIEHKQRNTLIRQETLNECTRAEQSASVVLWEIDLTEVGGERYFFCNEQNEKGEPVTWQGRQYQPYPIQGSGFELNGKGTSTRPTLTVSNLYGMVTGMAEDLQSLVGGTVVRRKVYARFLDAVNFVNGNSDADPEQEVISRWRIEQCSELSAVSASFVLSTPTETDGAVFPGRIMLANTCTWTYRGDECGYHGPAVADEYDQPTSDITKDKCSKCLSGCKFRNNVGNFGGFLSINKLSQ